MVRKGLHWTAKQREEALAIMAVNNGSRKIASKETGIPESTLNDWAYHKYNDVYRELRRKANTQIREATIETMFRRAEERAAAADELQRDLQKDYSKLEPRDKANALRNLDTGAGIYLTNAQKHLQALDQTPSVNINMNFTEIVRGMAAGGIKFYNQPEGGQEVDPQKVIEGKAEEISEA